MNFLAHLLLAGEDADLRCGGLLGDFIRGPLHGAFDRRIEDGIRLHRHIDASSGRHPATLSALRAFEPPYRRWAPIALDVLFDHYLATSFEDWHDKPLHQFSSECYAQLQARRSIMPTSARQLIDHMQAVDMLGRYAQRSSVQRALDHLSGRARHANPLAEIMPLLERHDRHLRTCFGQLMPALVAGCADWRACHG